MFDLCEGQPEPATLLHELEYAEDVGRVNTIARRCAARSRQDATRLVEPYRLAGDAEALGYLTDCHGSTVTLATPSAKALRLDLAQGDGFSVMRVPQNVRSPAAQAS